MMKIFDEDAVKNLRTCDISSCSCKVSDCSINFCTRKLLKLLVLTPKPMVFVLELFIAEINLKRK